jgi:hypothetical protein
METTGFDFVVLTSLLMPLLMAAIGFAALYFVIKAAVSAALRDAGLKR